MVEVTKVHLKEKKDTDNATKVIMYADICLNDAIAINGIKIIQGDESEYIAFPSRKDYDTGKYYDVVHPVNSDTRKIISDAILDKYFEEIK